MSRYLIVDYERSNFSISQTSWSEDVTPQIIPLSSMTDDATEFVYCTHMCSTFDMDAELITGIIVPALLACMTVAFVTYLYRRYRCHFAALSSFEDRKFGRFPEQAGVNSYSRAFLIRRTLRLVILDLVFVVLDLVLSKGKSEMNISEGPNVPSRRSLKDGSSSSRLRMHWLNGKEYTCINNFKLYVESWSGEAWDWWPLCPSFGQLGGDESTSKWLHLSELSTLSISRHAENPKSLGHRHWTVLERANLQSTAYEGDSSQSQSNSEQSRASSAVTRGLPFEGPFRATSKGNLTYHWDNDDGFKGGMDLSVPFTAVDIVPPSNFAGFILFGVHGSQRLQSAYLRLAHIDVFDKDDDGFFDQMIVEFRRLRGFFRRTFSIWVFHTCEFITVRLSDKP